MDFLAGYTSDDEDTTPKTTVAKPVAEKPKIKSSALTVVNSAPSVEFDAASDKQFLAPSTSMVYYNPSAESMWRPIEGPSNPLSTRLSEAPGMKRNAVTGWVETTYIDPSSFNEQYNTFSTFGYAENPSLVVRSVVPEENIVGNKDKYEQHQGRSWFSAKASKDKDKAASAEERGEKRKWRATVSDAADPDGFMGPWAPQPEQLAEMKELEAKLAEIKEKEEALTDEEKAELREQKKKQRQDDEDKRHAIESSVFHAASMLDSLGRSWLTPPTSLKPIPPERCFVPKKQLHTWNGHSKGVNCIRFIPKYGHLLLSASNDKTVKIWEANGSRRCMRTYTGHTEAVRDLCFTNDGTKFLSVSYDRYIKLWDTETGQCISRFTTRKIPFCAKLHPDDDKQNEFLSGMANKKIVQWDVRKPDGTVQEYDEHLGPVNSVAFIDENRRFVSTSDDKKVFVWEYGIPVVIKHISEPDMHSMPVTAVHPNGKYLIGQSMDNQVLVYDCYGGKFKPNFKKSFKGHLCAGYAASVGFSPDGSYVYSGDAQGRLFIWSFKNGQIHKKLKCHDQVTIGAEWHPLETSKIATCSWDGTIKYWD